MHIRDGVLCFDPRLSRQLDGLSFAMQFHGMPLRVTVSGSRLTVAAHREGATAPIRLSVQAEVRELHAGDECTFELRADQSPGQRIEV
jgi:trehalose/maltose hydrolase-like predicted phosphorylase